MVVLCPSEDNPDMVCEGELPFRTIIMLLGLVVHILVSGIVYFLFCIAGLNLRFDFLSCFHCASGSYLIEMRNSREMDTPVKSLKVGFALETQAKYVGKFSEKKNKVVTV